MSLSFSPSIYKKLLLITAAVVATVMLYDARLTLAKLSINKLLQTSGISVEELTDVDITWSTLTAGELSFYNGKTQQLQRLHNTSINFSLFDFSLTSVDVIHAELSLPNSDLQDSNSDLNIDHLLSQLSAIDNIKIQVKRLDLTDQLIIENIILHSHDQQKDIDFDFLSHHLAIQIDELSADGLLLNAKLEKEKEKEKERVVESNLELRKNDSGYFAKFDGVLDVRSTITLLNQLPTNSVLANIHSEELGIVKGRINASLSAQLPERLQPKSTIKILSNSQITIDIQDLAVATQERSSTSDLRLALKTKEDVTATLLSDTPHDLEVSMPAIELSLSELQRKLDITGLLKSAKCHSIAKLDCSSDIQLALAVPQLQTADYSFNNLNINFLSKLTLKANSIGVDILPGSLLEASLNAPEIAAIQKIHIKNLAPASLKYQLNTKKIDLQAKKISLFLSAVESILEDGGALSASSKFTLKDIAMTVDEQIEASAVLNADIYDLKNSANPKVWLPNLGFTSLLTLGNTIATTSGAVTTDTNRKLFSFNSAYDITTKKGTANLISDDIHFNDNTGKLSAWFSNWNLPADIIGGTLNINSQLAFDNSGDKISISGFLNQRLENISAYYQDTIIAGLSSQFEAEIVNGGKIKSVQPSRLTIDTIGVGIEIKDIALDYAVDTALGKYQFDKVAAKLLGGKVTTDAFTYNSNAESIPLTVRFNAIDIEQVLTQTNTEGVSCTGLVSGYLPLHLSDDGVSVVGGFLGSLPEGGILRYTTDGQSAAKELRLSGDIQTQIVNQILSNYHYDKLQADVNYLAKQDRLILSIKMQGKNPDIGKSGLAANFNPTVETSVLPLIEAQMVSGSVIQRLENAMDK